MNLIPLPPEVPSAEWLRRVAIELMRLQPDLQPQSAMRCAELAHDGTWLLEPAEAADWWLSAIKASVGCVPRRPRNLLG